MTKTVSMSLPKTDVMILNFLWRWKVVTSLTLRQILLSSSQNKDWNFYRKLRQLEAQGFVELKAGSNEILKYQVWQLTKKGFDYIVDSLDVVLRENGYGSENVFHDFLVTAFHLGEWIFVKPPGVELFSEQELRRNWPSNYPYWVPEIQAHRPDGYTLLKGSNYKKLIAVEVELSAKNYDIYQDIGAFYDDMVSIDSILWLVRDEALKDKILKAFKSRRGKRPEIHNFVLLDHFKEEFWKAKIVEGSQKGSSVREYYSNIHLNIDPKLSAIWNTFDPLMTFLKPVKSPYGMTTYANSAKQRKAD
ncbi:MAG: hypothetical protein IPM57_02555 [Oligoflexia bacterium]|nr:hypothetical protein [Oligoflexia bacterium]